LTPREEYRLERSLVRLFEGRHGWPAWRWSPDGRVGESQSTTIERAASGSWRVFCRRGCGFVGREPRREAALVAACAWCVPAGEGKS
jgi:hypothetical protein